MTRLAAIADGLWGAEHDLHLAGFLHFRGRMTVVKLSDGSLLLHSPIPIDAELAAELEALGPVAHLVAPNLFHHVHLPSVIERYPKATLWSAPGLPTKRKDIAFDRTLGESDGWPTALEMILLAGSPSMNEAVFFHPASASLILTDLVFNIHAASNWLSRLVFRMVGTWQRCACSRLYRSTVKDRAAFVASIDEVLAWDFERLIPAHGHIIDADPRAALATAMVWARPLQKSLAA